MGDRCGYIDDAADACLEVMDKYEGPGTINIGIGATIPIRELAEHIRKVVGYEGEIRYDTTKPDGMPRRLMDSRKIMALGWRPTTKLEDGLKKEYDWFLENMS